MVGGEVVEVLVCRDRVWINCEDKVHRGTFCAIYVEKTESAVKVKKGDSLWWQGREAMWTPQNRTLPDDAPFLDIRQGLDFDLVIPRIGNSGAAHPAQAMIERAYCDA